MTSAAVVTLSDNTSSRQTPDVPHVASSVCSYRETQVVAKKKKTNVTKELKGYRRSICLWDVIGTVVEVRVCDPPAAFNLRGLASGLVFFFFINIWSTFCRE